MEMSRLTSKYQATVPADVRAALGFKAGDQLAWQVEGGIAKVRKVQPFDRNWHGAASDTFADEWLSEEDEELFRDL
jgi:antitoxin PrlF